MGPFPITNSESASVSMSNVFQGWRRKMGVVVLVLACVVMMGGLRSLVRRNFLRVSLNRWPDCEIQSFCGHVSVTFKNRRHAWINTVDWDSDAVGEHNYARLLANARKSGEPLIPYWLLVLALTLAAGWLILWKPRPAETRPAVPNNEV